MIVAAEVVPEYIWDGLRSVGQRAIRIRSVLEACEAESCFYVIGTFPEPSHHIKRSVRRRTAFRGDSIFPSNYILKPNRTAFHK